VIRNWGVAVSLAAIGFWSAHCSSTAEGAGSAGAPDAGPIADAGIGADAGSGDAGGSTGADAGASLDGGGGAGGAVDAGSGGGGSVDAGSGGGESVDAGSGGGGPVDAGSGGGGSVDAGSGGGSLDGGSGGGSADAGSADAGSGGGGGVAAGCEGVIPDRLGSSFTFEVPSPFSGADFQCDSDTSDESGNIASHLVYGHTYTSQRWHFFDSNGAHRADFYALDLMPQGEGFEGIFEVSTGEVPLFKVGLWAPDGQRTDGPTVGGEIVPNGVRAWPNGILTLNTRCGASGRQTITLRRFDPALKESAGVSLTSNCVGVAAVVEDANGNRLILVHGAAEDGFGNDDLLGSWFDFGGNTLTGWFRIASGTAAGRVDLAHALIGGGAVLRIDGAWTHFIPSGKAEVQPAPAFLLENPLTDFTLVRGAKAYAVLPRSGDTSQMKLYSTSGNLCGTVSFPNGSLTTGADGSVIAASGDRGCTKTVWPGLLR
jgi:hypothetical protein